MEARILVVEDDLAMRELLVKVLENERFAARGASSGPEALALLTDGGFDLVLSDIRISPMDGLALASQANQADGSRCEIRGAGKLLMDLPALLVCDT